MILSLVICHKYRRWHTRNYFKILVFSYSRVSTGSSKSIQIVIGIYVIIATYFSTDLRFITEAPSLEFYKMKDPPLCIKIISVVMPAKIKFMTLNCKAPKPALTVNCTFQPMISKCFTNKGYWKYFTQEQIQVTYQNHGANFKPAHELNSLSLSFDLFFLFFISLFTYLF